MADTSVTYEGDGSTVTYSVPFPYINKTHVKVYVNSILRLNPSDYFWASTASITFRNAPADGSAIVIRRVTPGDTKLVNFTNGATLTEDDLNLAFDQIFYLAQEAKENYADLMNQERIRIGTPNGITTTDPTEWLASAVDTMLSQAAADTLEQAIADIDSTGEVVLDIQTKLDGSIEVIEFIGAFNGDQSAFILDSSLVQLDVDGGDTLAQKFDQLEVADSDNEASITTLQTVTIPGIESDVGALEARYGVALSVNGYVTGFVQNNDGTSGDFVILADTFKVVDPSGDPGETEYTPFSISGGKITMTGDVEINGNLLVSGSVDTGQLASKAAVELYLGTYDASQVLTKGSWTECDSLTVTTTADDVLELVTTWSIFSDDLTDSGQAQIRFRRFSGATPIQALRADGAQHDQGVVEDRIVDRYHTRFEKPGAGTWTYKVECTVPGGWSGNVYIQDNDFWIKKFKKSN